LTSHTYQTAPTQFVETNGIRFAYRRFGSTAGDVMEVIFTRLYVHRSLPIENFIGLLTLFVPNR
jgi:hypothetical protein